MGKKIRMHVLRTLFKKDFKGCFGNRSILITLLLPVAFALLYTYMLSDITGMPADFVLLLCSVMVLSIIPLTALSTMIAEEKEKHTLRSLMMAGVSGAEFILSKALVCLLLLIVEGVLLFFICGADMAGFAGYLFIMVLASLAIICFGAVVGIAAKDQMSAGTLGSPLMMLMLMPPIFGQMNELVAKIAKVFPTTSLYTVYPSAAAGESMISKDNLIAIGVCLVWIIAGVILFQMIYKKKGLDD